VTPRRTAAGAVADIIAHRLRLTRAEVLDAAAMTAVIVCGVTLAYASFFVLGAIHAAGWL